MTVYFPLDLNLFLMALSNGHAIVSTIRCEHSIRHGQQVVQSPYYPGDKRVDGRCTMWE